MSPELSTETDSQDSDQGRLKSVGINSIAELLLNVPRKYLDYSCRPHQIEQTLPGEKLFLKLALTELPRIARNSKPVRVTIEVTDGTHEATMVVFGNASPWQRKMVDDVVHVVAAVGVYRDKLQVQNPEIIDPAWIGRIIPVYQSKPGVITSDSIRRQILDALINAEKTAVQHIRANFDGLPDAAIVKLSRIRFPSILSLLQALHAPTNIEDANQAMADAVKLSCALILHKINKRSIRQTDEKSVIEIDPTVLNSYIQKLPYPLTKDQQRAAAGISMGLLAPFRMEALLSGDVGTGKSVTYLLPALAARDAGAKVVIMVPNALLVEQAIAFVRKWFPETPAATVTSDERPNHLDDNPLLIGTSALLHFLKDKNWRPDFLIIDEQQKTSLAQRRELALSHCNILEATATCLPKTAAMVTHGAMELFILSECPVIKQIKTRIVSASTRSELFEFSRKIVASGGQIAFIYPKVKASDKDVGLKDVESAAIAWEKHHPGRVGMVHGKMKGDEKNAVLQKMIDRELDILISSTVIEVGVHIPALKALTIVHPEKYGVNVLHQLRGRVARDGGTGFFFLYMPDAVGEDSMERIKLLEQHSDGFVLAEKDMEMRGFGDIEDDAAQNGETVALFRGLKLLPSDLGKFAAEGVQ